MGRGKIEIKRIENSTNRQVTYSKRRKGIMKKAKEIAVLCDAKVCAITLAGPGKIYEYCTPPNTVVDILDKYHRLSGQRLWDAKHESLSNEIERVKKENDNMQIELRYLKGEDITSLKLGELISLEETLENGLAGVRDKQMEYYKMMKKHELILDSENKLLRFILQKEAMGIEGNYVREMENPYHNSHLPLAFRVQPIQPNLQDGKGYKY